MGVRADILRRGERLHTAQFMESSALTEEVSKPSELTCEFRGKDPMDVRRGDYVEVGGKAFIFTQIPSVEKLSNGEYRYTGHLKDESGYMEDVMFMFLDQDGSQQAIYSTAADFDLTANIEEFLSLVVRNMNRVLTDEWSYEVADTGIDRNDLRNITFSMQNCLDALNAICEEYELEWKFEGGVLKVAREFWDTTGVTLKYPVNLLSPVKLTREDDSETCTRLFVFGGERNIPNNYGHDRLMMSGREEYLTREGSNYVKERCKVFDEIFPRRNSSITGVSVNARGIHFVMDANLDFNINDHLTDNTAKISFTSGKLVGYEFEIASYNHTGRMIELKQQTEGDVVIPNDTMKVEPGDRYVLLDIRMPDEYIRNAELELRERATKYFRDKCDDKMTASVSVSTMWLLETGTNLRPTQSVRLIDEKLGLNRRIRVTKVITYPFDDSFHRRRTEVTLSDFVAGSRLSDMAGRLSRNERVMYSRFRSQRDQTTTNTENIDNNTNALRWRSGADETWL